MTIPDPGQKCAIGCSARACFERSHRGPCGSEGTRRPSQFFVTITEKFSSREAQSWQNRTRGTNAHVIRFEGSKRGPSTTRKRGPVAGRSSITGTLPGW
jgi:hypothetical protein